MTRHIWLATILALTLAATSSSWAAEAASPAAAIVEKMPLDTVADGTAAAAEIIKLGAPAVREIVKMLVPPGAGADAKARFALNGVALDVARPGAEAERAMVAGVLVEGLESAAPPVKAFLASMLQLCGRDEAVPALAKLLPDADLCDPAARALENIGTPAAAAAIAKALPAATDKTRPTLVRTAGAMRIAAALPVLLPLAASADVTTRRLALYALSEIGDPSAADVLAKAASASGVVERSHATALYLAFARRLAETGNKAACAKICRDLINTRTAPRENNVVCDAVTILVGAIGAEATPELSAAMDSPNKQLREAALRIAVAAPGGPMTAKLVEMMKQAPAAAKTDFLGALARRGDKAALPAILDALKDADASVRAAAVAAAAHFAAPETVTALLALAQTAQDADLKAVQSALGRMPADLVAAPAAAALPKASPAAKAALLRILASLRATAQAEAALGCLDDADAGVRSAALEAAGSLADVRTLPKILALLAKATDDGERSAAQAAVTQIAMKNPDAEARAEPVLAALATSTGASRAALLKVLPALGGKRALAAVIADSKSADAAVQDAAVRALADWRTADEAADVLLGIARTAEQSKTQVLALRGYIKMAGMPSSRAAAKTVEMFSQALAAAKRPDEKRQALAGLANVHDAAAATLAATLIDDPAIAAEACAAVMKIVLPQAKKDKPLQGGDVEAAVRKVAAAAKDAAVRGQAEQFLKGVAVKPVRAKAKAMNAPMPAKAEAPAKPASAPPPAAPAAATPAPEAKPDAEGFVSLFNGKDLTGWTGAVAGYTVENGVIACIKEKGGNLMTEKEYADFVLRFKFKLPPGGNNGVGLRAPVSGDAAYKGMEIQVLDDTADVYKNLQPYQYHGSIYGVVPAKRGHLKPVGEWNEQEITARGRQITVKLNGTVIVDADIEKASTPETMDHKPHPGLKNAKGHIGFLGHGSRVEFRNIRIKELAAAEAK